MAERAIGSGDGSGLLANVSGENRLLVEARMAAGNASVETEAAVSQHALHTKVRSGDEDIESEALVTNHRLHTLAHLAPDDYAVDTSSVTVTDSAASTILDTATDGMGFVIQNLASVPLAIVIGDDTPDSDSLRIAPGEKFEGRYPYNGIVKGILLGTSVSGTVVGIRVRLQ